VTEQAVPMAVGELGGLAVLWLLLAEAARRG
jgi:hypothetical protein